MAAPDRPEAARAWLAGVALAGALRCGAVALGPVPAALSLLCAALLLGAALAPPLRPAVRGLLLGAGALGFALEEPLGAAPLPAAARSALGAVPMLGLPLPAVLLGLGLGPAFAPRGPRAGLTLAAGLGIGALVPLAAVLPLGLLGLLRPARPGAGAPRTPWIGAVGAGAVSFAATVGALSLRPALDTSLAPQLGGLAAAGLGLALGDLAVRATPALRDSPAGLRALLTGGLAAVGASALLPFGVGLTRALSLPLIGAPAVDLRVSVPALAAGLLGGLLSAAAAAPGRPRIAGAALGLALGASPLGADAGGLSAVGLGAGLALLLLSDRRLSQAAGALTAAALGLRWATVKALPVAVLSVGQLRSLRSEAVWQRDLDARAAQTATFAQLGGRGGQAVWAAGAALIEVELDGRPRSSAGPAAEAERLAGALAGLLAPRHERALLLGDDAGNAALGAAPWPFLQMTVSAPAPEALRALAAASPALRARYLEPGLRLLPLHPSAVLRGADLQDVIVEVFDAAWADAAHPGPSGAELAAARGRLAPDGVWIGVLHLDLLEDGQAAAFAGAAAATFPAIQAWLPPRGADSLILVGSTAPLPLSRLEQRFAAQPAPLRALGFPSAPALASQAIAARAELEAWAAVHPVRLDPGQVSGALTTRPFLHLGGLAERTSSAAALWSLEGSATGLAVLDGRIDVRRRTLQVIAQAAKGDVRGVVEGTRDLGALGDEEAERALDGLIAPQLRQAEAALRRARVEGPTSPGWEEASRAATTARLLAPGAPAPLLLLAEVAVAQGNLSKADELFSAALSLDEGELTALFGLARVARARGDLVAAETRLLQATRLHPREARAWHNLGVFWMEQGRLDEAEGALNHGAGLAGQDEPGPSLALGELALQREQPGGALVWAERAVKMSALRDDPKATGAALYLRGRAYFEMEQWDKAEDDLRAAVIADGQLVGARGGIGQLRARVGDLPGAIEAFKLVLQVDPNNAAARENLRRAEEALAARAAKERAPRPAAPPPGFTP
ncbi:MAG: tetratricopeptide repeat protein [Deltaproteobacteria bacterium]|nr:tetratricopeptide repeat protein [Deltaproteobacteria bacterium]